MGPRFGADMGDAERALLQKNLDAERDTGVVVLQKDGMLQPVAGATMSSKKIVTPPKKNVTPPKRS